MAVLRRGGDIDVSGIDPERLRWLRENSRIRLDADGRFWHRNEPVEHPGVIRLFRQGLGRAEDGRPTLRVGRQWCYIELEDVLFRVKAARCDPEQPTSDESRLESLHVILDDETEEEVALGPGLLALSEAGVLYLKVKDGSEWARLLPAAQASIGSWVVESGDGFAIRTVKGDLQLVTFPDEAARTTHPRSPGASS